MKLFPALRLTLASTLITLIATQPAFGWGHDGHSMINRLAAQYLPSDAPAFLRNGAALDIMDYLGPEPDRWHNKTEAELRDHESPDHFLDMEYAGLVGTLPRKRLDFYVAAERALASHPEIKMTPGKIGYQPWAVEEAWQRLKIDMRNYRKLLATNQDTAPVQLAILYDAAILGHYVADGSQPLHTTFQYNGWTGPNPNAYPTDNKLHSRFESVYVAANVHRDTDIAPLVAATKPTVIDDQWAQYLAYLTHSNTFVETVYQLDKTGAFTNAGTPEGKAFIDERIAAGAIELRDLIYSAWLHSADPTDQ